MYLYPPHFIYVTIFHLVLYPFSSSAALLGGIPCALLYSYTFFHKEHAGLFFCCISCGLITCTVFSSLFLCLLTSIFGYSHLKCLVSQYLKHCTFSLTSYCLISTSPLTSCIIILLASTSNLFWETSFLFCSSPLFL